MTDDLDRFDRMLLASDGRAVDPPPRPPRYVDYTECSLCDAVNLGIEYHGELMSGAKVHMLAAHSAGDRRVAPGQPRCLGSGLRLVFKGGVWKGLVKP